MAPPCRAVERGGRARQRRIGIDVRAADRPHGGRAAVLLVVGVQDEQHVERARQHRVRLVLQLGHLEQHVQEVAGEAEVVVRIHVRPADAVAVRVGGDARHFGDQPVRLPQPRALVEDLLRVGIERRERADRAQEDPHRVRVVLEPLHELLDVLVQHRVERDLAGPGLLLRGRRQLAEQDQIRRFEEVAVLGQLFDRIAAIEEDAFVAVDVGDRAAAVGRVHERRVVRHEPEVVGARLDLAQIHGANRAVLNRQLVLLPGPVVDDCQRVWHGRRPGV